MLEPKTRPTSTIVMPLNVDVTDTTEKTVIPLEMIKESLKKIDYIAGMDSCLCRDANDCKDYIAVDGIQNVIKILGVKFNKNIFKQIEKNICGVDFKLVYIPTKNNKKILKNIIIIKEVS